MFSPTMFIGKNVWGIEIITAGNSKKIAKKNTCIDLHLFLESSLMCAYPRYIKKTKVMMIMFSFIVMEYRGLENS